MTANELRLGNIVQFYNGVNPAYYSVVTAGFFASLAGGRPQQELDITDELINAYYSGIALTPEILEKCGFAEVKKNVWIKGRLKWHSHLVYLKNEDTDECYYIPTIIDHLHQLQNLYYALTGEELNINL